MPKEKNIPTYYIGTNKKRNYQARYVVSDFDCTYNIGTAVTYCLRASRKHNTPIEDIHKAIAHLRFELERLNEININKL
jgi:hypothetical protein|tara:strand:- start:16156 stop:16392 length:237 start_codon:yes stop_codon:yes gene_type:complete